MSELHSLYKFTEEEEMIRDTVREFAQEELQPHVAEMDAISKMIP